tara:strand:+ start:66 stop:545 length:480 start_codon:yes stop_codon:yes gene_type:complete
MSKKTTKVESILKSISKVSDKRLARSVRISLISSFGISKKADSDQHGIFQNFQDGVIDYETRDNASSYRRDVGVSRDNLYGIGPEHGRADNSIDEPSRSLSTRYSPDRVGVQARRVSDGVYQDPYTNKIYDYNEGFKTEDGSVFSGGTVDNQTKIVHNN